MGCGRQPLLSVWLGMGQQVIRNYIVHHLVCIFLCRNYYHYFPFPFCPTKLSLTQPTIFIYLFFFFVLHLSFLLSFPLPLQASYNRSWEFWLSFGCSHQHVPTAMSTECDQVLFKVKQILKNIFQRYAPRQDSVTKCGKCGKIWAGTSSVLELQPCLVLSPPTQHHTSY